MAGLFINLGVSLILIYILSIIHEIIHYITARILGYNAVIILNGKLFMSTSIDIEDNDKNLIPILLAPLILVPASYILLYPVSLEIALITSIGMLSGSAMDIVMAILVAINRPDLIQKINKALIKIDKKKYLIITKGQHTKEFLLGMTNNKHRAEKLQKHYTAKLKQPVYIKQI
jgi:hypothetical protein